MLLLYKNANLFRGINLEPSIYKQKKFSTYFACAEVLINFSYAMIFIRFLLMSNLSNKIFFSISCIFLLSFNILNIISKILFLVKHNFFSLPKRRNLVNKLLLYYLGVIGVFIIIFSLLLFPIMITLFFLLELNFNFNYFLKNLKK